MENAVLINYRYSEFCPKSKDIDLRINGEDVFVYDATVAYFASVSFQGEIDIEVTTKREIENLVIRPLSKKIKAVNGVHNINFSIAEPMNLFIEINNQKMPLFLFANPLEEDIPSKEDQNVIFFESGKIYDVGILSIKAGQTLYIEGGAVLKGFLRVISADNVRVCGRGILDSGMATRYNKIKKHQAVFEGCNNLEIEGITLIEPPLWMLVIGACNNVYIKNIKEIGYCSSSDGIDIVGSKNVTIDGIFIRNNDDCVVIKAMDLRGRKENATLDWSCIVENIIVKNSVLYTSEETGGSSLEIGFELRTDYIRNVVYENIDIIAVHGFGSVFGIHNGDRATIRNIKYQNIRVEHFYDRMIDFRVLHSPLWNKDSIKGEIRDIYFKDIYMSVSVFNEGYTHSLLSGYSENNTVEGITFENFNMGDKIAQNEDDLWIHKKHAGGINFK